MHLGRLEITTHMGCSINCRYCPQKLLLGRYFEHDKKRKNELSLEDFKVCVDKLPAGTRIDFSGMAEPWLNSACTDMVLYAAEKGFPITVYTTLVGMTPDDFERIQNVNFQEFVLHIPDDQENSHIPITEEYLELLERVIRTEVDGIPLVTGYSCHAGIHPAIRELVPEDSKLITELADRAGNLDSDQLESKKNEGAFVCVNCGLELNHNVLLPDGTVLLCCMDYGMEHVLGNLLEQSYEEILSSAEAVRVRQGMRGDGKNNILCRTCTNGRNLEGLFGELHLFREWCGNMSRNELRLEYHAAEADKLRKELEQKYNARVGELKEYKQWVENLQKQESSLKEDLEQTRSQYDERVKELEEYRQWVENLLKQEDSLKEDLEQTRSQYDERVKELEEYRQWVENLQKQETSLKEELAKTQEQYAARVSELGDYRQWVENLQKREEELRSEVVTVQRQHDARVAELQEYKKWVENLQRHENSLMEDVSRIRNQYIEKETELEECRKQAEQLKVREEETRRELERTQGQNQDNQLELRICQQKIENLQKDQARLETQIEEIRKWKGYKLLSMINGDD